MWPSFLPDGRHFLYQSFGNPDGYRGIYVASLDSSARALVLSDNSNADYVAPGYLLFVRDRALMAEPFDAAKLRQSGAAFAIGRRIGFASISGGNFTASENGILAYGTGDDLTTTQMAWYDRAGKRLGTIADPGGYRQPQLSPDGSKLIVERLDPQTRESDVWMYEPGRGLSSRLTSGQEWHAVPVASSDMSRIAFLSRVPTGTALYQQAANGKGKAEVLPIPLLSAPFLCDWSRDGEFMLFAAEGPGTREDLWILPMSGNRKAYPFLQTEFSEEQGQFSPNGKWIAYVTDETGMPEVYVQSFPATGPKYRISTNGGTQPRWRGDGKEIFYLGSDRRLMAVAVSSTGGRFEARAPVDLFQTHMGGMDGELGPYVAFNYAVTADGKRFLLNEPFGEDVSPGVSVILNWTSELARADGNRGNVH